MDIKEWAKIQESLLKSQLKIIREVIRQDSHPRFKSQSKGKSQMSTAYDVLHVAGKPLHISEIISRARDDFSVELDRDSIVSALAKKVRAGRTFKRVAPNTFTVVDSSPEKNPLPT